MSITNLQNKVFEIENPIEIDFAVNEIRKLLATLQWVSNPYHIAQRFYKKTEKGGFYYPETFIKKAGGKYEYHPLTPDNDYKGMFFFVVGKGVNDYRANELNFLTYPVSIIFSANLKLIEDARLEKYLFTQELIRSARRLLTEGMMNFDFDYKILSETRDLREVYKEFVLDDIEQYNRAPLQCFRIDLSVRVQEDCYLHAPEPRKPVREKVLTAKSEER